ncbi:MAG: DUF2075 domain-containing protein [Candidatus Caenarcaniphilales bacterium]|nr:DUF2075 domain-containing protein [Candidatus Caenarcaniphilales bacterium]
MKPLNLLSIVQAYNSLDPNDCKRLFNFYGLEVRGREIEDLQSFIEEILKCEPNHRVFSKFYVGYKIPQIGKEFDLLWLGSEYIINIELKSSYSEEKVFKQLTRNHYYLSFLGKQVHTFTYVSKTKSLYKLVKNRSELETADFSSILSLLIEGLPDKIKNIDHCFNPSDYLVSPFNSPEKFLKKEYFLTHQQEDFKTKILATVNSDLNKKFVAVTGSAGTGKTLLTYDIARELQGFGKKVLLIHCGNLNEGQNLLKKENWEIIPIKTYEKSTINNYDVLIIDESQRIYKKQLDEIISEIQSSNCKCIFSYDKIQTLSKKENSSEIGKTIEQIESIIVYKLSEKIRTNKEIASFIQSLFNIKINDQSLTFGDNVELYYFNDSDSSSKFLESLDSNDWKVLRFTPSQYDTETHNHYSDPSNETSHKIIGQEFDGVAVVVDKHFSYDSKGKLIYTGKSYYDATKMLFQNMTRTRKKLCIVLIENSEILSRCMYILQKDKEFLISNHKER